MNVLLKVIIEKSTDQRGKWWINQLRVQGVVQFGLDGSGKLERTQNLKALEHQCLSTSLYSDILTPGASLTLGTLPLPRITNS